MGSLLAPPAKCGIIFIGILIGQVGLPCPFLMPVTLPATSLKISQQFPGLPLDLRVRQFASLQFPIVPKRSHYARSKWIHPAASNPLCEEANSRIPRNPRIQEHDVDSTLWKASEHLCLSIRHRATLTPIERSLESTICGRAFIRHPANLPFPPLPRDGPPSASQMGGACQLYGEQ